MKPLATFLNFFASHFDGVTSFALFTLCIALLSIVVAGAGFIISKVL